MPSREWQSLALDLVEQAAAASSREALLDAVFGTLAREVGLDSASIVSLGPPEFVAWNKPPEFADLFRARHTRYLRETQPWLHAAIAQRGVAQDRDVFSIHARDRMAFYSEFIRSLGASSTAAMLVRSEGSPSHVVSFSRYGRSRFRQPELDVLRRLRPAVSLAVRVCPGDEARPPARPDPSPVLTPREAQIADYVSRGFRNAEIAALCGTSPFTVRNQLQIVFRKLDVTTRAELTARYLAERGA